MNGDRLIGAVRLTAGDANALRGFYERTVGLQAPGEHDGAIALGAGEAPLVELAADPEAPPRPPGTTGLFHLAIVVPDRLELARALRRVADSGWRFTGASDHLVSEALYLRDPEGNGIEIYRDRRRAEWPHEGGELQMDTLPLDLRDVLAELGPDGEVPPRMAKGTRIGHVHLNVGDLSAAEAFYGGTLGLDVTVRGYPGALFLSAAGYHHHVGLNTWAGEGAPAPPAGARGLAWFELELDGPELEAAAACLRDGGHEARPVDSGLLAADPSGNRVLLRDRAT